MFWGVDKEMIKVDLSMKNFYLLFNEGYFF